MKKTQMILLALIIVFIFASCNAINDLVVAKYTVTVNQSSGGVISISPQQSSYESGATITVTATPNSGYVFTSWGGSLSGTSNPVQFKVNSDATISATFTGNSSLSISITNTAGGSITVSPSKTSYSIGESVTFTASPGPGFTFGSWGGDLSGTSNPTTVTLTKNYSVIAYYTGERTATYAYYNVVSSQLALNWTDSYHYPSLNNGRYDTRERVGSGTNTIHRLREYTRDVNGLNTRFDNYNIAVSPRVLLNYALFFYNASSKLVRQEYYNASSTLTGYDTYTYDSAGRELSCMSYNANGSVINDYSYTRSYDSAGKETGGTLYVSSQGTQYIFTILSIDYDSSNRTLVRHYTFAGAPVTEVAREVLAYDSYGKMTSDTLYVASSSAPYDLGPAYEYIWTYELFSTGP